jgi:pilus assembly protein CpaB
VARTVTVEVTPENVALLNQARNTGRLSLSLRGTRDETVTGPVSVDQTALVGVKETPVEVKEEAVPTVVVRRGVDAQQVPTGAEAPAAAPEEVPAETQ